MEKKRWLSPSDIESEFGISKSTLAKWRMASNSNSLRFSKIGGKFIRYDRLEINKWLESNMV